MTNFNFLTKFEDWLGELSSRMSLVGVSCDASGARVAEIAAAIMLILTVGVGNAWGDPTVLFHETFGNNTGSARAWDNSYSVKFGVSAVYSGASETVTNAKQSKNTMGSTQSGLVSNQGATGSFIIGPLDASGYTSLGVSNYWGISASPWHSSSILKCYYSTNGSSYTEVSRTDSNGDPSTGVNSNANYKQATYSLPAAAQVSTLYLKFEFYHYKLNKNSEKIGQAYLDEVELTGTAAPTCTELGQINGSINLTSSTDGTVTVSGWAYDDESGSKPAESNVSSYTVKLYKYNSGTSSWALANESSTTGGESGTAATRTGIAVSGEGSKSVTYSGLEYGATYKFTVTAIGTGSYCDGDETAVTSINGNSLTDNKFLNKYYIHIDDGTQSDSGWEDHYFSSLSSHSGSVDIALNAFTDYYQYKLSLGGVVWWGNNAKMTGNNHSNWALYTDNGNVKLQTAMGGAYTFTLDAATPAMTVTYPSANQAAGYKIYWDNSVLNWSTLRYRIGNNSNNQNHTPTLVPGTDNFYVVTTPAYNDMEAWHFANNPGWADSHTIYRTATNNESGQPEIAITASTTFQQYKVTEDITVIPTITHSTGTDNTGDKVNNQCEFYTIITPTSGMLTHTATITPPSHGTINIAYTDVNSAAQNKTATTAGLAHRTILTVTATPATGYKATAFTVTPSGEAASNLTSGATDNHILAKDATFAATFAAKQAAITFDKNSGTSGDNGTTATYGTAMTTITAPTRDGYTFGGYYDAETSNNGSGTQYYNANGTSARTWDKDTEAATTLYANWSATPYTITYHLNDGTNPGGVPTGFTIESALITLPTPTREGYNFMGWYANENLSTGGVQTTIAAASTGDKEYWAKWEIKKYTVTWHVGESTSTTSNVAHFTTFSTLEASAPAHADNALAACGSTKFIGWVKASGEYTEDGKTADWYDTHKFSGSDQITADTHVYAMYAEASGAVSDVLNTSNVNTGYTATNSWTDLTVTGSSGAVYKIHTMGTDDEAIRWNSNGYLYCSSGPTSGAKLQSVTIITTANKSIGIYGSTTAYSAKATATSCGNLSATSSGATYNFTSDYNYIGLNGTESSTYINSITISYGSYSNYRTGCTVSCSRPTPATPASITKTGATISWTDPATSGTLDHYEYKVWEDGDDEPVSGTTNGTNLSKALTGLYSGVTYHWKVRRVCSGEDASIWVAGLDFTTTDATLTFSVPTGATAVDPSTTATNLPEADAPTDCGDCWAFVGWTTAAYAESSSAPATLFPAGIKARVSGDATLYAVYKKEMYDWITSLSDLEADEYYILTSINASDVERAMTNTLGTGYFPHYTTSDDITIKEYDDGWVLYNPSSSIVWKLSGTYSSGRLYNEAAGVYLDLSVKGEDVLKSSASDNLVFSKANSERFDIASATTSSNYLYMFTNEDGVWGIDDNHEGYSSCYIYKRQSATYATTPSCPKYTVTWDVNNGASTSTTEVTKCQGYLASLPDNPSNTTLSSCQTNGKFMGWSANKVMPAQDIAPADMFSVVGDAPEITEDVTFYAVFANGVAGAATLVNTTYTFNSKSWGDATNSWSSNTAGDELTSGRGIKIVGSTSAEGITKNNYTDVTKVVVTYCTNASSGAGSVTVTVGDTEFGTNSISKPSSGGATLKTFTYTHAAATGKVKISASASTNSIYIYSVQIYYTGAGTVYEQYRTACCNDPGFSFTDENDAPTEYVIVREDLASASDAVEIDCNYTSANTEGAITWYSTRRAALGFPATGAYTWTTPSSQPVGLNIDIANKKISASATGVWTITISQADGGTTYCPVDAVVTVRVKTVDKFVDAVNGNFGGDAQRREDTGDGITLPTEAEFSIDDGCSTERRLLGWVKESDLSSYTSGYIDTWKTNDASNKVIAPGTKVSATGITWYAVWGTEK